MPILHTESSNGWGGQEIRILKEAIGLRSRGHEIIFAVVRGGKLVDQARKAGFTVYEIDFHRSKAFSALRDLLKIIRKHKISIVNTHSSLDSWLGGIAGKIASMQSDSDAASFHGGARRSQRLLIIPLSCRFYRDNIVGNYS